MYPLNDNDLDRLSREAANQYDVPSRTSGWEALEHRLNKELPPKEDKERRRFLFWLFLIVLVAGGGVMWTMTRQDRPGTIKFTGTNTVKASDATVTHRVTGNSEKREDIIPNNQNETATGNTSDEQVDKAAEEHTGPVAAPTANNTETKYSTQHNQYPPKDQTTEAAGRSTAGRLPVAQSLLTRKQATTTIKNEPPFEPKDASSSSSLSAGSEEPSPTLVQQPNEMAGKPGAIKALAMKLAIENKETPALLKRISQPHGWEIGLLAGPDMSNVRFTDADKAGMNVGLQVGYRFNNRWSVNSGLIYTRKNYTAQGKDFTKPGGNYWDNADVRKVSGDCAMFDIPLNVRYDLSLHKKTRWFVSAGASSYIMTNQNYTVDYLYNGTPRLYPHEEYGTSTYLFSIVNVAAGVETKLNKHLSFQAEPYLKLPMKGLGYGKLDLTSYGLYLSLRYQLHK